MIREEISSACGETALMASRCSLVSVTCWIDAAISAGWSSGRVAPSGRTT